MPRLTLRGVGVVRALGIGVLSVVATVALAGCGDDGGGSEVTLSAAGKRGQAVAEANGCVSCHTIDGARSMGPTWQGLAGSKVQLEGGYTVVADDAYLTRAIRDPRVQVRAGFENLMPVAYGKLTDAEVADLVAYINDLVGN